MTDCLYWMTDDDKDLVIPTLWLEKEGFNVALWYAIIQGKHSTIAISDWPVKNQWVSAETMRALYQEEIQSYLNNQVFSGDHWYSPTD